MRRPVSAFVSALVLLALLVDPAVAQSQAAQTAADRNAWPQILPDEDERSQDDLRGDSPAAPEDPTARGRPRWILSAEFRYSVLSDHDAAARFAAYDDLFSDGIGGSLVLGFDFLDTSTLEAGPYLSLGVDQFDGGRTSGRDDVLGTVDVRVDDMVVWTAMLGIQIGTHSSGENGGFFAKAKASGGLGHYDSVDADLSFRDFGQDFTDEPWYDSSTTWAMEAGARIGWGGRNWTLFVGSGFRAIGDPDDGGRLNVNAGSLTTIPVETGVEIKF